MRSKEREGRKIDRERETERERSKERKEVPFSISATEMRNFLVVKNNITNTRNKKQYKKYFIQKSKAKLPRCIGTLFERVNNK